MINSAGNNGGTGEMKKRQEMRGERRGSKDRCKYGPKINGRGDQCDWKETMQAMSMEEDDH